MRLFGIFLLFSVVCLYPHNAQSANSMAIAVENYDKGNYAQAYQQFRALAELGMADAQFNIGVMYLKGQHVEQQLPEAYAWIALAAEQGREDYSKFSQQVLDTIKTQEQRNKAQTRFAELNATHSLEVVVDKLRPVPSSDKPSIIFEVVERKQPRYPIKAARALISGVTQLQFYVYPDGSVRYPVVMYSEPEGLFEEVSLEAIGWWKFAAPVTSTGELVSTPQLVTQRIDFRMERINSSNPAVEKYAKKLQNLVKQDDPIAKYLYAVSAASIHSIKLEQTEVDQLMLESAMAGVPEAQFEVAQRLLNGERCKQDKAKAYHWLEIAALADHPPSQYYLAERPSEQSTIFSGNADDWHYLMKAAESGYPAAVMEMAWRLTTASNATTDTANQAEALLNKLPDHYERSVRWYEVHAAIDALNGDFAQAEKRQKRAIKRAKKRDWETSELNQHLQRIETSQRIVQLDLVIPQTTTVET